MHHISGLTAKFISFLFAAFLLNACRSDPDPEFGRIQVEFDNVAGDKNLALNGETYVNKTGENFVVTMFNYYISNIRFSKTDGSWYTIPQDSSYFLIREDVLESQLVTLNVPYGDYDQIEFMIGVDSLRNTMDLSRRTGVLDIGGNSGHAGMYWSWNSGYIFMKLEGTSTFGNPVNDKFYYHLGLFGGYTQQERTVNNTRVVKLKLGGNSARVNASQMPKIRLLADVLKVFDGPGTTHSIAEKPSVMAEPVASQKLANNYAHMFSYGSTN